MSGARGDGTASPNPIHPEPSLKAVFDAYFVCRKGKRNSINQLAFEADLETNIVALWRDLTEGRYRIGRSIAFVVRHPKIREVWAADFRDRVVHHLIHNAVRDRFERRYIRDSYACIPGRGNHDGRDRMTAHARALTLNWTRPGYFLKMDVANFFNSIDRRVLLDIVLPRVPEPWLRTLIEMVILHDPRHGAVYKSSPEMFGQVPCHKSLRQGDGTVGLPIGNHTSQFFANVYLNELDQFVKRTLKAKHYGRYVDDMVILHECPRTLLAWQKAIDRFLGERLRLRLHPRKTQMNLLERGLNFIGFIIKPGRCYLRRSTVGACKHRIRKWERGGCPVDPASLLALCQSVTSYLGMLRQVDGYRARRAICGRVESLFVRSDAAFTKVGPA